MRRGLRWHIERTPNKNLPTAVLWGLVALVFFVCLFSADVRGILESTGLSNREAPDWFCLVYNCAESRALPYPLEIMVLLVVFTLFIYAAIALAAVSLAATVVIFTVKKISPSSRLSYAVPLAVFGLFAKGAKWNKSRVDFLGSVVLVTVVLIIIAFAVSVAAGAPVYRGAPGGYGGLFYTAYSAIFFSLALRAAGIKIWVS